MLKWVAISLFAMLMFPARRHSFNSFITIVNSGQTFQTQLMNLEAIILGYTFLSFSAVAPFIGDLRLKLNQWG